MTKSKQFKITEEIKLQRGNSPYFLSIPANTILERIEREEEIVWVDTVADYTFSDQDDEKIEESYKSYPNIFVEKVEEYLDTPFVKCLPSTNGAGGIAEYYDVEARFKTREEAKSLEDLIKAIYNFKIVEKEATGEVITINQAIEKYIIWENSKFSDSDSDISND